MAYSDEYTDEQLEKLQKRINRVYSSAYKNLKEKASDYFYSFEERWVKERNAFEGGKYTEAEFKLWEQTQLMRGKKWEKMRDDATQMLVNADKAAVDLINGVKPDIFAENYNYEAYKIESAGEYIDFTLLDKNTVLRLMSEDVDLLPTNRLDERKDEIWNARKIQGAVLQGILSGDPIDKIADRLESAAIMDRNAAVRNARTAVTSAQNGGRQKCMEDAKDMGIDVVKEWLATEDERTRESHREMDGVRVDIDDDFPNGLAYPADPKGAPEEVYNCRCTMITAKRNGKAYGDYNGNNRNQHDVESYNEWKRSKLEDKMSYNSKEIEGYKPISNSKKDLHEMYEYGISKGVRFRNYNTFDGEISVLKNQIDEISEFKEKYGIEKDVVIMSKAQAAGVLASTENMTISYNRYSFRDSAKMDLELKDSSDLAAMATNDITLHECGHLLEHYYRFNGVEILKEAYYNVHGNILATNDISRILDENVSFYATDTKENKNETLYREITSEVLVRNKNNPNELTNEYVDILNRRYGNGKAE